MSSNQQPNQQEEEVDNNCWHKHASIILLIDNPTKGTNWGSILRCATAFGITTILAVGYGQCAVQGSQGAHKHVKIVAFPTTLQALSFLNRSRVCIGVLDGVPDAYDERQEGCPVYRVVKNNNDDDCSSNEKQTDYVTTFGEIYKPDSEAMNLKEQSHHYQLVDDKRSYAVDNLQFILNKIKDVSSLDSGKAATLADPENVIVLALSKHRNKLSWKVAQHCDFYVHVPHVNLSDIFVTVLDKPACLSIILHHLTTKVLQLDESKFDGHKFKVGSVNKVDNEDSQAKRKARQKSHQERLNNIDTQNDNDDYDDDISSLFIS